MRPCVIFNPAAKGQKAERFRRCLKLVATECVLKTTTAPAEARRLAAEAIGEGFETLIAAGGDGTLNEVLNGMGDAPDGFDRARLGVLPLGTVNVFARELGFPTQPDAAWQVLRQARESRMDLAWVEHAAPNTGKRDYFAQMAGAGLDARAIQLVKWSLKKKIGPFAYVEAGLKALSEKPASIVVSDGTRTAAGQLVLIGNGRFYGGSFRIFPQADSHDGLLDVCVFPQANWLTLLRCAPPLLLRNQLPASAVVRFQGKSFTLSSPSPARLKLTAN